MSESTGGPSRRRKVPPNPYTQAEHYRSLALFLAARNQPVPDILTLPVQKNNRNSSRSNKRRKHVEHPEVFAHFLFPDVSFTVSMQNNNEYDCSESSELPPPPPLSPPERASPPPPLIPPERASPPPHRQQPEPHDDVPTGPSPLENDTLLGLDSPIDELKKTAQFICGLRGATLEKSNMQQDNIDRLRAADPDSSFDIEDKHFVKSLRGFLSSTNAPQATYNDWRDLLLECYPDDPFLSLDQMKRRVEQLSGVVPIYHDMCKDTCVGFTGPLADCEQCPICGSDRYQTGTREPLRQFITIPLGPVIQALYASPDTAENMHYRERTTAEILEYARTHGGKLREYNDTTCGRDYLNAVEAGKINRDDVLIQFSLDGAQLYRDKESDCWIFVYIIHNLPPELRYKKNFVIPAGFIPGPEKMKDGDSFIYPVLYHISALQNEGLRIWDASTQMHIPRSIPLVFVTADSPAMAMISGMVGHSGKFGCRLYCGLPGRHRERDGHYYPVMLKPEAYNVAGCDHNDVLLTDLRQHQQDVSTRYNNNIMKLLRAENPTQFKDRRLETGLCKQTIFSGLHSSLGIPNSFPLDIMHLINLNDPDLLLGLWRGTIKVYPPDNQELWTWRVLVGDVWQAHGKTVALATPFIPSSFGRAPRNPAEKINSGYKAWEFQIYLIGLGPALLRHILPRDYWLNYCKYVSGIRLLQQRTLSPADLQRGHKLLYEFTQEFEELYYQRRADRIHFVRQSIHLLNHLASETVRIGPLSCYSQWTIETAIGNLGAEIRQDRNPYANIAQRGVLRAQLNSILAMFPHLKLHKDKEGSFPQGAKDLGQGYALLRMCQKVAQPVDELEANVILRYWEENGWPNLDNWTRDVKRWARLRLPNGQTVRCRWYESQASHARRLRKTTCVKVVLSLSLELIIDMRIQVDIKGMLTIAEVEYFFQLRFGDDLYSLALVSVFSPPDQEILRLSSHAAYICHHGGTDALTVVDVKAISAVVSMVPDFQVTGNGDIIIPENTFSLVETSFIKLPAMCGVMEQEHDDDGIDDNGNDFD